MCYVLYCYDLYCPVVDQMASSCSNHDEDSRPKFMNRYCHCGRKALLQISTTEKHPNMLFYKCDKCKYFSWWEDDSGGNVATSSNTGVDNSGDRTTVNNGSEWLAENQKMKERLAKVEANLNGVYVIVCFMVVVFICILLKM